MFDRPKAIPCEEFAAVPARLRKQGGERHRRLDIAGNTVVMDCFLEGPAFDRQGRLYCVDIPFGRVFRISPDGTFDVAVEYKGRPNSIKIYKDGRLFIADRARGVLILDPATGAIGSAFDEATSRRFKGLNDLVFAGNGDLYFTDFEGTSLQNPTGGVYRLSAGGKLDCLLDNVPGPNGIALNPADNVLYIAATFANAIWRLPIMDNGAVGKASVFAHLAGGGGPDGLAVDEAGNLCIAQNGLGRVWVFNALGEPVWSISTDTGTFVTNLAYGGADRRTLYILESQSGTILTAAMPVPGKRLFSHL